MYAPQRIEDRCADNALGEAPQRRRKPVPPLNAARDFKEFKRVEAEKDRRLPRWREVFNYMMPDRLAFEMKRDKGETPTKPVDSYPAHALQRGCGNLIAALFPHDRVWFEFKAGTDIPEAQHDAVNEAAERWRDKAFNLLGESEFGAQLEAMMPDVFCSLGGMRVDRGQSIAAPADIKAHPLNELFPLLGRSAEICGLMRRFEEKCCELEALYPGHPLTLSAGLKDKLATNPDTMIELLEICRTVPGVGQRITVYHFATKDVLLDHVGRDPDEPSPWVIVPWRRVAGEAFGRGPADRALETARYYNHARTTEAKAHDRRVDPAFAVDTEAFVSTEVFSPTPRSIIPYSSRLLQHGGVPFHQIVDQGNVAYEDAKIQGLKDQLDDDLFASRTLPPVTDSHGMTAAEIRVRWMQKLREEGVDFGVLNRSFGLAFVKRYLWVLQSWGIIPPVLKVNGKLFEIRYAGPLATAQDADDAVNLETGVQSIIATVGESLARTRLRLEDVPAEIVRKRNMPSSLIRPEEEAEQMEQAERAAQVAQVAAENGLLPQQGAPA